MTTFAPEASPNQAAQIDNTNQLKAELPTRNINPKEMRLANASGMMSKLDSPTKADFSKYLAGADSNLEEQIRVAIENPGKLVNNNRNMLAIDPAAAKMLQENPGFIQSFIQDGQVVGQAEYKQAVNTLDNLEQIGSDLLALHASGKMDSFKAKRLVRNYKKLAEKFEGLTDHDIKIKARVDGSSAEATKAIESQHQQAREKLVNAFSIAQNDYMEMKAGRPDFNWVVDPNLESLLKRYPELQENFKNKVGLAAQQRTLKKLFATGQYERLGLDRNQIIPENGVLGSKGEHLSVEQQIKTALNSTKRKEILDLKLANPTSFTGTSEMNSMDRIVRVFGNKEERALFNKLKDAEHTKYSKAAKESTREALRKTAEIKRQEQQRITAEKQEKLLTTLRKMAASGNVDNSLYRKAMRNPETLKEMTNFAIHNSREGQIKLKASSRIAHENASRQLKSSIREEGIVRDIETTAKQNGFNVDLSHRVEAAQVRQAAARQREELSRKLASGELPTDVSYKLKSQLDGLIASHKKDERESLQEVDLLKKGPSSRSIEINKKSIVDDTKKTLSNTYQAIKEQQKLIDKQIEMGAVLERLKDRSAITIDELSPKLQKWFSRHPDLDPDQYLRAEASKIQARFEALPEKLSKLNREISNNLKTLNSDEMHAAKKLVDKAVEKRSGDKNLQDLKRYLQTLETARL